MMNLTPYPEYKDSGIEWLGEVPEHWDTKPIKYIFKIINGSTPKSGESDFWDGDIPWATPDDLGSLVGDTLTQTQRMITQEGYANCGTTLAPEGSLVISTRAPIGYVALTGMPLCTNQGCRCLAFRIGAGKKYYYYQVLAGKQELESLGQGSTFKELGKDELATMQLAFPPVIEANAILSFLDRETARIDALIAKKQRQIELLQEKRTALISQVVTKGLDPNVKMKDSGVEWLGEVPEHWVVISLRYLFNIKAGGDLKMEFYSEEKTENHHYPIYTNSIKSDEVYGYSSKPFFRSNTITVTGRGEIGYATYRNHEYDAIIRLLVLTPKKNTPCKYYSYFINSMISFSGGSTAINQLSTEQISPYKVFSPPLPEQKTIVEYLDCETAKIDILISKIGSSIEKLQEYRTALISAAVTGKIDVRGEKVA